jgi:hypothetical protein
MSGTSNWDEDAAALMAEFGEGAEQIVIDRITAAVEADDDASALYWDKVLQVIERKLYGKPKIWPR